MYLIKCAIATLWPMCPVSPIIPSVPPPQIGGEREMSNEFRRPNRRSTPIPVPLNPNETRRQRPFPPAAANYGIYTRGNTGRPVPINEVLDEYQDEVGDCDCEEDDDWYIGDDLWVSRGLTRKN